MYLLLFTKLQANAILQVLEVREFFCEDFDLFVHLYVLSAWESTLCRVVCPVVCLSPGQWPRIFWQTGCVRTSFPSHILKPDPVRLCHISRGKSEGLHTQIWLMWTKKFYFFFILSHFLCLGIRQQILTLHVNVWPLEKLQVINLCCSALSASVHQRRTVAGWSNVFLFFFLTVLLRFIQEIEMNMGPGQAKQCQLRAFLTYYINDLFLNQVCKIEVCQLDSPALGAFKTHSSFPWDERLFLVFFF